MTSPMPYEVSNSEIQTFLRCRRKWWLTYIERWRPDVSAASYVGPLALGSRVHKVLENFYKKGLPLMAEHSRLLDEARLMMSDDGFSLEKLDNEGELGRLMLEGYEEWVETEGLDADLAILGVEEILKYDILPGQVRLIGKIDLRVHRLRDDTRAVLDFKEQPLDEPVLTPGGWSTMGAIKPGDYVVGSNWSPVRVVGKSSIKKKPIYRINFTDGTHAMASAEHPWPAHVWTANAPQRMLSTTQIHDLLIEKKSRSIFMTPVVPDHGGGMVRPEIDPYFLGAWIANGHVRGDNVTDGIDTIDTLSAAGLTPRVSTREPSVARASVPLAYKKQLISYGLIGLNSAERFIPSEAILAPLDYRWRVLRGLMDGDGGWAGPTNVVYYTSSIKLAEDFSLLVRSLGGHASIKTWKSPEYTLHGVKKYGKDAYRVYFRLNENPFQAHRKNYEQWENNMAALTKNQRHFSKKVESVDFVGEQDAQCLKLSCEDHLYVTRSGVLTHNTSANFADVLTTAHMAPQLLTYMTLDHATGGTASRVDGGIYRLLKKVKRSARAIPPYYQELVIRHNVFFLRSFWARLRGTLSAMFIARSSIEAGGDPLYHAYPTPTRDCSWSCPFLKICPMFDDGSGAEDALRDAFVKSDPYDYYKDGDSDS